MELPAIPMYLQFKRADCMTRRSVWEIRDYKLGLELPFFRFKITESGKSNQHEMLLHLDDGENLVYYVAPRFHRYREINDAWSNNAVASRSIFVSPQQIGILNEEPHHVAYDSNSAYLCSEPREVRFQHSVEVLERLQSLLENDARPLGSRIGEIKNSMNRALIRTRDRAVTRRQDTRSSFFDEMEAALLAEPRSETRMEEATVPRIPTRPARPLSREIEELREISDAAAKVFGAQLLLVQPRR
ncbi:hypothetical protein [Muricoccus pecuniae]|uniref:Uncharacterized protein n=1 Tax=Muricoccus pecuniae TaxID=693023 RepID=A0A840XVX6_9PROT|nr:hypothetical protein [Roseomonas pecuniae]MBB5692908.1 hypothetical protein [Roseomonas pecuniae]